MARLPTWAEESGLDPNAGRRGSSWKGVLAGLLLVGVATFVAAYYLPLHRAHKTLTGEHQAVSQKIQALESAQQKTRVELEAATRKQAELEVEHSKREAASKALRDKATSLKQDIAAKLDKHVSKGAVVVALSGERVQIGISASQIFVPNKAEVSAKGKALLCDVAKAAGSSNRLAIGSVSTGKAPAAFDSGWEFTAARAASVADALEDKCNVSGSRLSATGHAAHAPKDAAAELGKLPNRVEIDVVVPTGT